MEHIHSLSKFLNKTKTAEISYLLLYKNGSPLNDCAFNNIKEAAEKVKNIPVFAANVSEIRDIHPHFGIDSVPSFIEVKNQKMVNNLKGCNTVNYYQNVLEKAIYQALHPN